MKTQPVRGTHDLYGDNIEKYNRIQKTIKMFAKKYDFNEIVTPIFESTELFKKPLGEHSDVVLKEMYSFNDRNNSSLTLRPEYTTPMIRAAISNNLLEKVPQKFFGIGPMFRRERPQKGRYRQFNQINFEIFGTHDMLADAELIILANDILKYLFPAKKIELQINSLGDKDTLKNFKNKLSLYFNKNKEHLSEDSQTKIQTNPLRILDSKYSLDQQISQEAPKISDFYSKEANNKFIEIKKLLLESGIDFVINHNLVRGLDYYCHTVFEFKTDDLGSQNTLIGGGRYDGLIKLLGGPDMPGVGWAGGIERISMLMQNSTLNEKKIHLILMNDNYKSYGLSILTLLRKNNFNVSFDYKYNLKKSLSNANQLKIEYVIIIGEEEFDKKFCTVKNLKTNIQKSIKIKNLIEELN